MAQFEKLTAPSQGTPIRFENGQPVVADNPIILSLIHISEPTRR